MGIMGKYHVDEGHEKISHLQMLGKSYEENNMDQAPIEIEEKDEGLFSIRKMADHFPYGSTNIVPYSSINWVDRDTLGMNTVEGKEFIFCNEFFVLTCGKPQRYMLHPLDTTHTPTHEVHFDLHVLEEIVKQDEVQELACFL